MFVHFWLKNFYDFRVNSSNVSASRYKAGIPFLIIKGRKVLRWWIWEILRDSIALAILREQILKLNSVMTKHVKLSKYLLKPFWSNWVLNTGSEKVGNCFRYTSSMGKDSRKFNLKFKRKLLNDFRVMCIEWSSTFSIATSVSNWHKIKATVVLKINEYTYIQRVMCYLPKHIYNSSGMWFFVIAFRFEALPAIFSRTLYSL